MTLPTMTAALLSLAVSAASPTGSSAPAGAPADGDLARIQGTWTTHAGARGKVPVTLEIRGDQVTVHLKTPQGLALQVEGAVRLNEATTPKSLDWVDFTAPDGEQMPTILAIYEFDGEALRVCNGGLNDARPSAFRPGESPLASVVTFRRPAPKPAPTAPPATAEGTQ